MPRSAHYGDYAGMTEVVPGVFIHDGGIYIVDDEGEVCCWVETEWQEDPTVTNTIAFAVALATAKGASAVRKNIENKGGTLDRLIFETFTQTQ